VLAVENAIASIQLERNLITLDGQQVVPEFVYKTTFAQPSQPVTPFIDNTTAIDVTTLPKMGQGAACPVSANSLCQRIYTIMRNLLADPVHAQSLTDAHAAAGVTSGTTRRLKVACSFQFPVAAVAGGNDTSIAPLVPIVLARSFDIDGHEADQVSDFAVMYADAIANWANTSGVAFGPSATPKGAVLVFDLTLYAALAGVNTPVLRLGNLQLKLTDIDPV
jgi:large repetitive protein